MPRSRKYRTFYQRIRIGRNLQTAALRLGQTPSALPWAKGCDQTAQEIRHGGRRRHRGFPMPANGDRHGCDGKHHQTREADFPAISTVCSTAGNNCDTAKGDQRSQ
jgi:hypothetical protein